MTTDRAEPQQPSDPFDDIDDCITEFANMGCKGHAQDLHRARTLLAKRIRELESASPAPDPAQEAAPVATVITPAHSPEIRALAKRVADMPKDTRSIDEWANELVDSVHRASPPAAPVVCKGNPTAMYDFIADAVMVLRMVDENNRLADGEKGIKAWNGDFVKREVRRVLGEQK